MIHIVSAQSVDADAKHSTPTPASITVTSTERHSIYSLCSTLEMSHHSAQPCDLGVTQALIEAVVRALSTITTARRTRLLNAYSHYREYLATLASTPADSKASVTTPLLPIVIRTDNRELIEAAQFLRDEDSKFDDETSPLKKQLRRFDVRWVPLPINAPELQALKRWAEITCHPGDAQVRNEETRGSYRARIATFEAMDQDGHSDTFDDEAEGELAA